MEHTQPAIVKYCSRLAGLSFMIAVIKRILHVKHGISNVFSVSTVKFSFRKIFSE